MIEINNFIKRPYLIQFISGLTAELALKPN